MKKSKSDLEEIERFVQRTYNRRGKSLRERLNKPYDYDNPELGYSYKDVNESLGTTTYNIVAAALPGKEYTAYRIKIHEYGHIYLTHFEGIHKELDQNICNVFKNYRGELIEKINKNCGIDFADKLIERVIDDPILNHSLHNIAMDMEVNSKLLSDEDVDEMEMDVTEYTNDLQKKYIEKYLGSSDASSIDPELKKKIEEELAKPIKEAKVKFILPCRYHFPDGTPFPNERTYSDYLIMIIKNLDQFVKMLVNINNGGNGDTSEVTDEELKEALQNGMQSLDSLMGNSGMSSDDSNVGGKKGTNKESESSNGEGDNKVSDTIKYKGSRDKDFQDVVDHCTPSRKDADCKRSLGQIKAGGGCGCGSNGGTTGLREVQKLDPVDEAIDEAIEEQKSRVVKFKVKRDLMKNWNLGRNRTVIAPSVSQQVTIDTDPKIVYLIDISGSMNTDLIDRIISSVAKKMRKINRGLHYDIITWSTHLGEHIKDIDPKKSVPRISMGGGTRLAEGIKYFKEHYNENSTLIVASDFEDYLEEWINVLKTMNRYTVWGFNYGRSGYSDVKWPKNFRLRNFNKSFND